MHLASGKLFPTAATFNFGTSALVQYSCECDKYGNSASGGSQYGQARTSQPQECRSVGKADPCGTFERSANHVAIVFEFNLREFLRETPDFASCAELIETLTEVRVIEAWTGVGSIAFAESSRLDPWNRLPVKRVIQASYMLSDMTLGFGKVIDHLE